MINDSKSDFESLTINFTNKETFLYYEELISYCKLLTDNQRQLLLRIAKEMIVGKNSTKILK